jgi:lipopolysaccharide export system protein LptA
MKPAILFSAMLITAAPAAMAQDNAPAVQLHPVGAPAAHSSKPKKVKPAKTAGTKSPQSNSPGGLGFGSHDNNAPINVSSDSFVGDLANKIGTYIGNVIVIQGDMRLRADQVKVHVAQGKPTHIEAIGKVVVSAPNGTATGDNGVYELTPRTITMTGHVVLTKEKDVMRGTKLVMDMNTNLAHLYAQGMPGGRVQGLFIPPPQKAGAQSNDKKSAPKAEKPARIQQTIDPGTPAAPAENPTTPPK